MSSTSSTRDGTSDDQAKIVAILSAASGTGCTSTVANLAFVLARAGRRVLVIDWGSDLPRVREYLEPFYVGQVGLPDDVARSLLAVHSARPVHEDDPLPTVARFELPDSSGYIDVIAPADEDGTARSYPNVRHAGLEAIVELRKQLPRAGYDELLVDAPTGSVDASLKVIALLCDLAVVCFRPRPRAIRDAAEVAARLRRDAPIGIGVVPVATVFGDPYQPRVERIRSAIHTAFIDSLAGQEPRLVEGGAVEIPYRSYDTFDPVLTVLVEEPLPDNLLHAAYGRLAAAVTDGAVTEPVPVSEAFRARYQRVFGLESAVEPDQILVAYAAPDRPWADWVRGRLERSGAQTETLRRGQAWLAAQRPLGLVIIVSEHLEESDELAAVTETLARATAAGTPLNVFRVLVGKQTAPDADGASVAVRPGFAHELAARLLNHFGLIDRPSTEPVNGLRLPGDRPEIFSVPPRYPGFVGRDDDIEELRDQLVESTGSRTMVTLSGVPGVGKSELALEYAYRFAGEYDVVWWVPAGDEQSALVSLAHLAASLDEPGANSCGTTAALERLASDAAYRRFLLIYDNIQDRTGLDELLPSGHRGHVIITSSEDLPAEIELTAMTPRDSALLLASRVPGLSPEDAARAAAAAGHLPMVLELAGTWLAETAVGDRRAGGSVADSATWAVSAFCDQLDGEFDAAAGSWQDRVFRVVAVVADSLRTTSVGQVTLLLAQMCSFLSQEGISLDLVRSKPMLDQLIVMGGDDTGPLRLDASEIDRALWTGVRYGLFRVDWGRERSLRLHRVVQAALRAAMTPQERTDRRRSVLESLAAFAPSEVEEFTPHCTARFAELQKHVFPSGATDSDDDMVRRWLINQVGFLFTQGGPGVRRAALGPTQKLLDDWTSRHGPADPLRVRLANQLANLYRAVGDHQHALRLDDAALAQQRQSSGKNHPQSLFSALGRGGDLRGLGLFDEALQEDQATWSGFRETFGEDHPLTRMAAHNLASAMFLSGDVVGALALAERNHQRRLRLMGENDVNTWAPLIQIGVYRRELGDYENARIALFEAAQRLGGLQPELNPRGVVIRWHQAIVLRCQGDVKTAKERNGQALGAFRELLGPEHPNTLACKLSFAAAHRAVGGDLARGVELTDAVLDSYLDRVRLVEEHPFVALARIGLGLAQCAAGINGSSETAKGWELLQGKLGGGHPWTLAAAVDHARVTAASGATERATELIKAAHEDCVEFLGVGHPYTAIAEYNLRLALARGESVDDVWREIDVDVPES